jgi:hypothetical protein
LDLQAAGFVVKGRQAISTMLRYGYLSVGVVTKISSLLGKFVALDEF